MKIGIRRGLIASLTTVAAVVLSVALTPQAAQAATWTSLSGWVNTNGTWTVGEVVRYFAGSDRSIRFHANSLPGCCLDIQTHEKSLGTFWGGVGNIQSARLGDDFTLNSYHVHYNTYAPTGVTESWDFGDTMSGYFRIWHRNTVVGSDNSWTGSLAYNYPY